MKPKTTALLAGLALPGFAYAQTDATGGQPIVVTATRIATPVSQAPADVTVLTQQDFINRGDTTLAEALTALPGVNLVQSGGPGNAASLFVRGTNSEDVLVLMDGVPVNDPANPNGAFNFGIVSLADIERIEIVRGPMSGLYGSSAIGGVVNIITKRGNPGPTQASISVAGGYPAQGQGSASVSGVSGKFDYALSGALDQEAGFDSVPERMGSIRTGNRDPYRAWLGAGQFGYSVTPATRFYAIFRGQATDAAFPDLNYPVYDDPNEFDYNTSMFGKLGVSSTLLNGRLSTDLFIARLQTRLFNKNLLDANDPNFASADDTYAGSRTDAQWNNTLRLPDTSSLTFSNFSFGAEYTDDSAHENVNENSGSFTETVRGGQHSWAGHIGLQTTVANRLTLSAALRDDAVSSFGNAFTWRLGGAFAVPEAYATIKASAGTGFLAPSLFDLDYVDNYGDNGNPNLKPEYSTGWDIGPDFALPLFGQPDGLDISATYFSSNIRDLIQSELNEARFTYTEQNISRASIHGVETNYTFNPAPWLSAELNYTYTRAVSQTDGSALLRRPQNSGSATLTIRPMPGLTIVPQVQYTGRFNDYIYQDNGYPAASGNPAGTGSADPGTLVNLNITYRLDEHFTVFANGKNILNSKFEPTNGLQTPGASFLIGIRAAVE